MRNQSDKSLVLGLEPRSTGPGIANNSERRKVLRYPCTATTVVTELRSATRVVGRSSDLGPGGCYIDTLAPFSAGTIVRVRMDQGSRHFEALATVVYAHLFMGMGLAFTKIDPEQEEALAAWVAELSGEQVPETEIGTACSRADTLAESQAEPAGLRQIVIELINLMIRRRLIGKDEGAELLNRMSR